MKVQAQSSLEPPPEYNQDQTHFIMTFLTILGVIKILCSFRLVLEGKIGKEIEFLEKFIANNFTLSEAEDTTSRPLNRGGVAYLPLPDLTSFWEVMNSFALVAYASLAASRTFFQ